MGNLNGVVAQIVPIPNIILFVKYVLRWKRRTSSNRKYLMHLGAKVAEIERYFRPIGWGALPLVSNRKGSE